MWEGKTPFSLHWEAEGLEQGGDTRSLQGPEFVHFSDLHLSKVGRLCHSSKSSTVTCAEHGAGHCPKAPGSLHKRPESSDLCFGIRMLLHENARKEIQLPTQMRAQDGNAVHHKAVAQGPPLIKE